MLLGEKGSCGEVPGWLTPPPTKGRRPGPCVALHGRMVIHRCPCHTALGDSWTQVTDWALGVAGACLKRRWENWHPISGSPCHLAAPAQAWASSREGLEVWKDCHHHLISLHVPEGPSSTSSCLALALRAPERGASWEADLKILQEPFTPPSYCLFHPGRFPRGMGTSRSPSQQIHGTPSWHSSAPCRISSSIAASQEVWVTLWPQKLTTSCQGHS